MSKNWEDLDISEKRTMLENLSDDEVFTKFSIDRTKIPKIRSVLQRTSSVPRSKNIGEQPSKQILINARRGMRFDTAICELIDNSLDCWIKNGKKTKLKIKINYDLDNDFGTIEDNAGGISYDDIWKPFTPGHSTNFGTKGHTIGSFGQGATKAIFRLSDCCEIISSIDGKSASYCSVPEGWLDVDEWDNLEGGESTAQELGVKKGQTLISFLKLQDKPDIDSLAYLNEHIAKIYYFWIHHEDTKQRIVIELQGKAISSSYTIPWSDPPGAAPRDYIFTKKFKDFQGNNRDYDVKATIRMGLTNHEQGSQNSNWGVTFCGNGRVFAHDLKGKSVGWGVTGYKEAGGCKFLLGIVNIEGPGTIIPWNDLKNNYVSDTPVGKWLKCIWDVTKAYHKVATQYSKNQPRRIAELKGTKADITKIKVINVSGDKVKPKDLPSVKIPEGKKTSGGGGSGGGSNPGGGGSSGGSNPGGGGSSGGSNPGGGSSGGSNPGGGSGGGPSPGEGGSDGGPNSGGGNNDHEIIETDPYTLAFDDSELLKLENKFGIVIEGDDSTEKILEAIRNVIFRGISFELDPEEIKELSVKWNCSDDVNELSEQARKKILKAIEKP